MKTSYDKARQIAADAICPSVWGQYESYPDRFVQRALGLIKTGVVSMRAFWTIAVANAICLLSRPITVALPQLYAPEAKNRDEMTQDGIPMYEQKWDYEYNMKWPRAIRPSHG